LAGSGQWCQMPMRVTSTSAVCRPHLLRRHFVTTFAGYLLVCVCIYFYFFYFLYAFPLFSIFSSFNSLPVPRLIYRFFFQW
jgi:hypothetical protein